MIELIWGVLAVVVCVSQYADGASWSLIMAAVQAVVTSLIFVLSIRRGTGGLTTAEIGMIAVAGAGVVGWVVADEAARGDRMRGCSRPHRRGDDGPEVLSRP